VGRRHRAARRATWKRETKFSGFTTRVEEGGREFLLLKPSTYMNESGRSVSAGDALLQDRAGRDADRARRAGPRARRGEDEARRRHRRPQRPTDIADAIDSKDFWRLRIGIGHPGDKDLVADYVLDRARRAEQDAIDPPFERSLELLPKLAGGRIQDAIGWLHTSPEDEAKRKAALEARKESSAAGVLPVKTGTQSPKEEP
jgi:PTH1 family peptidyl-tRNA hydrolase